MSWMVRRASMQSPDRWSTVELAAGGHGQASALAAGGRSVWVAGTFRRGDVTHWVVQEGSTGTGGAWTVVDRYVGAVPRAAVVDGAGRLFVAGEVFAAGTTPGGWLTRRRDADRTWSNVDVFRAPKAQSTAAVALAVGPDGVYALGNARDRGRRSRWILRKSGDGGATWTTVAAAKTPQTATDLVVSAAGKIHLVGYETEGKASSAWVLLQSGDGGSTWGDFSSERPRGGRLTAAQAVIMDGAGGVFVGGSIESSDGARWVLRRSRPGGTTLETVDDYRYARSGTSADKIDDLALDIRGGPVSVGDVLTGRRGWMVRGYGCKTP